LPSTLANVAFQSLLADALTPQGRARALAARTRLISVAGIMPLLLVGRLLDVLSYPFGYQLIFCAAFAIGIVEAVLLLRLSEIPAATGLAAGRSTAPTGAASPRRGATLTEVLANREFVQFDMASFVLYLGWGMAGPLWTRYRVSIMGANNTWISIYSVVEALAAFGALYYWVRLGERRGSRNVLWWIVIALAGNVWTLASIVDLRLGVITPLWCGIFNSGANLFLFNSLLEIIPANRRASYIAYHTTVINLAHLGGPLVAVAIMDTLGIRPALVISGFIRAIGGLVFLRFRPQAETGTVTSP
jgi:Na+/melibiose symporter-like transporter